MMEVGVMVSGIMKSLWQRRRWWCEGLGMVAMELGLKEGKIESLDPDQEERAALLLEVQTLIIEQLQEESKKAQGVRLPVLFPEMREVDSSAAESIMYYDLEISRETNAESPWEWLASFTGENNAAEKYDSKLQIAYASTVQQGLASSIGLGTVLLIVFSTDRIAIWYGSKLIMEKGYSGGKVINITMAIITVGM
ncbi:ABC transporter B family member 9-like [Olea europaea subsp. europaea]|uniref:ABC transporter B family member 9-like n=1 Tax=Olea europaea subsp. europaea TaxID=158383 RepID=A0A8S0VKG2_OLEEU|nr:ABC transporter B family member 9-like [Olea europaea subsp. europaea]